MHQMILSEMTILNHDRESKRMKTAFITVAVRSFRHKISCHISRDNLCLALFNETFMHIRSECELMINILLFIMIKTALCINST
jgi:hypothetical protein